jgi:predicted glutamine amidotransferase
MCLIIHKPPYVAIREGLIRAAGRLNPSGWGLMGVDADGGLILKRRESVELDELLTLERELRAAEYFLHLRQRARGSWDHASVQPLDIGDELYLMHNGTLPVKTRTPGESRLAASLTAQNKLVLLDYAQGRFLVINRLYGMEFEGLWLSNARWVEHALFPLDTRPPQERSYRVLDVLFL